MNYPESFERLISNGGYDYIGNGNPNVKILIISKERSIDRETNEDMYMRDIIGNRGLWLRPDDNVAFPYRGQKCHLYLGVNKKTGKVVGEGGTSRTWLAYQHLSDAIFGNSRKKADEEIWHYKIFCVNGKYGIQKRVPYFLFYKFAK